MGKCSYHLRWCQGTDTMVWAAREQVWVQGQGWHWDIPRAKPVLRHGDNPIQGCSLVGGNRKRTRTSDTLQAPVSVAAAHIAILALLTVISLCVVLTVLQGQGMLQAPHHQQEIPPPGIWILQSLFFPRTIFYLTLSGEHPQDGTCS